MFPEDEATFSQGSIKDNIIGEKVQIVRAIVVNFNLYGTPLLMHTRAATVADLLKEKNVTVLPGDTVTPAPTTIVTAGISVFVIHNGKQVVTIEETVPAPIDYQNDPSLYTGQNVVRDPGAAGKKAVTYELMVENGKEISRRVIQEVTISTPIRQVVARGTKPRTLVYVGDKGAIMAAAGVAASDYGYVDYIVGRESGWCATKWQGQVGYCPPTYEQIHSISSGFGYGLCQSTPAIKMASAGADWPTNPVTQLRWCASYAKSRYGSWGAAYNHWLSFHSW